MRIFIENVWNHYYKVFYTSYDLLILYFSLPLLVMIIELICVGWHTSSFRKLGQPSVSLKNDIVSFFLFNTKLHEILGYGMLLGLALHLPQSLRDLFGYNLLQAVPNIYIQAILFFIVSDFLDYLIHRVEHKSGIFWQLHKYHHSCEEFTVLTAHRSHPLTEVSIKRLIKAIPLAVMGMPMQTFLLFVITTRILSFLQHSQLNWSFGWVGRYILISPIAHRIHHSVEEQHFNKNYGGFLVWWDKIFGTWMDGDCKQIEAIGIKNNNLAQSNYFKNIYICYRDFVARVWVFSGLFLDFFMRVFQKSKKMPEDVKRNTC